MSDKAKYESICPFCILTKIGIKVMKIGFECLIQVLCKYLNFTYLRKYLIGFVSCDLLFATLTFCLFAVNCRDEVSIFRFELNTNCFCIAKSLSPTSDRMSKISSNSPQRKRNAISPKLLNCRSD